MKETPRQRFIRNHEERLRIMRMRSALLRREGKDEDADRIDAVVLDWGVIGLLAEEAEEQQKEGE